MQDSEERIFTILLLYLGFVTPTNTAFSPGPISLIFLKETNIRKIIQETEGIILKTTHWQPKARTKYLKPVNVYKHSMNNPGFASNILKLFNGYKNREAILKRY
jgi:hypothetical protein